jgi:hypothetical protein
MAGILSGLSGLGLGKLNGLDLFEKEEKKNDEKAKPDPAPIKQIKKELEEKDFIFDKTMQCPVCDNTFTSKIMKSGKARLIGTDFDLRPKYDGIDALKYEVYLCPRCGYAAFSRYFSDMNSAKSKLILENISKDVKIKDYHDDVYSYEEALERFKLSLVNAVVKKARTSEKAYICLKTAWLYRGYQEELMVDVVHNGVVLQGLKDEEEKYLHNALDGFTEAFATEDFPMCGMDVSTVEYLLAQLNTHFKKYDVASKLVSDMLLSNTVKEGTKKKVRILKEQIIKEVKERQAGGNS